MPKGSSRILPSVLVDLKPYVEPEDKYVYLKVHHNNICEYIGYGDHIKKRLTQGKAVPVKFFEKMMSFLVLKDKDKEEHYQEATEAITKNVVDYFNKCRNSDKYVFSVRRKLQEDPNKFDIPSIEDDLELEYELVNENGSQAPRMKMKKDYYKSYTFEEMIEHAVKGAIDVFMEKGSKKDLIETCYYRITGYVSDKKIYNDIHYRATVISGYIALNFGHALSADVKPSTLGQFGNSEIFAKTNYSTKGLNPVQKKKRRK